MRRLGWVLLLGLASCRTSIDFEQGRPYTCAPDAGADTGACGAGWRCGIEGRCHAIGDARPWVCRASTDCEASWRCGLEGTCHDPSVLSDYLCTGDEHCTAPWRCGFSGRCLDATSELSTTLDTSPSELTVLGPRFFTGQPEALVGADMQDDLAIVLGTQVRFIRRRDGGTLLIDDFDAGSVPRAVAVDADGAYVIDENGVRGFRVSGMRSEFVPDAGVWLVGGTRSAGPFVVQNDVLDSVGAASQATTLTPPRMTQVALANCVYLANSEGLWVQEHGGASIGSGLGVMGFPNQSCSMVPGVVAVGRPLLRTGGRSRVVLAYSIFSGLSNQLSPDGGPEGPDRNVVGALDVTRLSDPPRTGDPQGTGICRLPPPTRTQCGEARITPLMVRCPMPCDVGDRLTDLRPGDSALEVECTGALGQTTWSMAYDGECSARVLSGQSSRFREVRTPGETSLTASHLVQRGPHGQIWVGDGVAKAQPFVLDEPPGAVLRPRFASDGGLAPPRVVSSVHSTRLHPLVGLVTLPAPETLTFVSGTDDLALLPTGNVSVLAEADNGALIVTRRVAAIDALPEKLRPPFTATLGQRGDAGVLLVSADDGLYAADEGSWASKVPLRLVPQPGFGVLSLALLPGAPLNGYVNTRSSVFAVSSGSELEWKATPVPLPPGQLVEVWVDQGRARVGFADGRVLTLPSGVPLTSPLPAVEFVDYLGVCGQLFGLTRTGLMRVDSAGKWAPVPLPGGEVVLGDTLGSGRLLERDGLIYVFNGSGGGLTFRLSAGCPRN
ncbi:MAG: hypothetical protein Q8L48_37015 [Archangium sp.]|nr:hypothetical protein [Archangium sp.]